MFVYVFMPCVYLFAYMIECLCLCARVFTYVYKCLLMCVQMYSVHVYRYVCSCVHVHELCMHSCVYTCLYFYVANGVFVCAHVCLYVRVDNCMFMQVGCAWECTCAHVHVDMEVRRQPLSFQTGSLSGANQLG